MARRTRSIVDESREIQRAVELIGLGARLQVLETETSLSRERLLRLYKEIRHVSPPKGMLPFSTDWFMTWNPNIQSSLFIGIYRYLDKSSELDEVDTLIKAYKLYLEQIRTLDLEPVLTFTRAWRLVKFIDASMLTTTPCETCGGQFLVHAFELVKSHVCGLCNMPSRAGKGGVRPRRDAS